MHWCRITYALPLTSVAPMKCPLGNDRLLPINTYGEYAHGLPELSKNVILYWLLQFPCDCAGPMVIVAGIRSAARIGGSTNVLTYVLPLYTTVMVTDGVNIPGEL